MNRVLLLLLLLVSTHLPAQQGGTGADTGPAASTGSAKPEPAEDPNEPDRATSDPFTYESSEQISEDLSVSFPVDI